MGVRLVMETSNSTTSTTFPSPRPRTSCRAKLHTTSDTSRPSPPSHVDFSTAPSARIRHGGPRPAPPCRPSQADHRRLLPSVPLLRPSGAEPSLHQLRTRPPLRRLRTRPRPRLLPPSPHPRRQGRRLPRHQHQHPPRRRLQLDPLPPRDAAAGPRPHEPNPLGRGEQRQQGERRRQGRALGLGTPARQHRRDPPLARGPRRHGATILRAGLPEGARPLGRRHLVSVRGHGRRPYVVHEAGLAGHHLRVERALHDERQVGRLRRHARVPAEQARGSQGRRLRAWRRRPVGRLHCFGGRQRAQEQGHAHLRFSLLNFSCFAQAMADWSFSCSSPQSWRLLLVALYSNRREPLPHLCDGGIPCTSCRPTLCKVHEAPRPFSRMRLGKKPPEPKSKRNNMTPDAVPGRTRRWETGTVTTDRKRLAI